MGANPYCYFTRYQPDAAAALEDLRQQEFAAGRYDYALQAANPPSFTFQHQFPPGEGFPAPGAQHPSIEEALRDAMEGGSGTGSILDIVGLSDEPSLCFATPMAAAELTELFATATPSRADVETIIWRKGRTPPDKARFEAFWGRIWRGEARYFAVYDGETPSAWFFAGMSLD